MTKTGEGRAMTDWEKKFKELQKRQSRLGTTTAVVSKTFIRDLLTSQRRETELDTKIRMIGLFHGVLADLYGKDLADILMSQVNRSYDQLTQLDPESTRKSAEKFTTSGTSSQGKSLSEQNPLTRANEWRTPEEEKGKGI